MEGSGPSRRQIKKWLFLTALWEQTPCFLHKNTISKPMYAGLTASPSVYIQGDECAFPASCSRLVSVQTAFSDD